MNLVFRKSYSFHLQFSSQSWKITNLYFFKFAAQLLKEEEKLFFSSLKLACRYNNLILRGSVEYSTDHFTFSLMTHQNMCLKKLIFLSAYD